MISEITRRHFILASTVGGAALLFNPRVLALTEDEKDRLALTEGTVLIRNPAFSQRTQDGQPVLLTTTADGKELAYRTDSAGLFIWEKVPTPAEHRRGKNMTARALMDLAVEKYGAKNGDAVRGEAFAFLKQALDARILVGPQMKNHIVSKVAHR